MPNKAYLLDVVAFVLLLSLPFLSYVHAAPISTFYNEWIAAACMLGVMLAVFRQCGDGFVRIPLVSVFFVSVVFIVGVQMALDMVLYPSQGRLFMLYLVGAFLLVIATNRLVENHGMKVIVMTLSWAILAAGVVSGVIGVLQYWEVRGWFDGFITSGVSGRAYANLAQPNHYANLMALSLVALLYIGGKRRIPGPVMIVIAGLLVLGLVLAFSRTAWLYLIGLILMAALLRWREKSEFSRRLLRLSLLFFSLFVCALVILGWSTEASLPHAASSERMATFEGNSINIRLAFLREAWQIFMDAPLLGVGYQQFSWQHFLHQSAYPDPVFHVNEHLFAANAHNLLFQFLAEFGLVGALVLLSAVAWIIRAGVRNLSSENWPVFSMLLILAIHSQFEYPLYYMYFLALAAVLLALVDDKIIWTVPRRLAVLPAAFTILLGGVILATMLRSYGHLEEAYGGTSGQIVFKSSTEHALVQAGVGGFFEPEIDQLINIMPLNPEREGASRILLETSQRAVRHRTSAPRVYRHVLLLALEGHDEEADEFLGRAARAYPRSLSEFSRDVDRLRLEYPDIRAFAQLQAKVQAHLSANEGAFNLSLN